MLLAPSMLQAIKQMAARLMPVRRNGHKDEVRLVKIPRDSHRISRKDISDNALKVLSRLRSSGHEAYLVGGSVRDLLLGEHPKDFDIATDATPEQVRGIFRNSRVIGRRFRIVHVLFGPEVIEVTTFRGPANGHAEAHHKQSSTGMLVRDNVYGTLEDDAWRRDFTVNALYYTIEDFSVLDFCNGMEDLENRCLRVIGDPDQRYREDPVRMLRAIRFAAKLGFELHRETAAPIPDLASLLDAVAPARMFDEILKLLMSGYGARVFPLLLQYGLVPHLMPAPGEVIAGNPVGRRFIEAALTNTDDRIQQGKPVTPAFIFAALLWYPMSERMQALAADGMPLAQALDVACAQVLERQQSHSTIPKRFSMPMREIWQLQHQLEQRRGRRVHSLLDHPRFRAAYDFLLLREQAGEDLGAAGDWWTVFQQAEPHEREQLVRGLEGSRSGRKRRRRTPANQRKSSN